MMEKAAQLEASEHVFVTYCNDGTYATKDTVLKVCSTQQGVATCIKTVKERI